MRPLGTEEKYSSNDSLRLGLPSPILCVGGQCPSSLPIKNESRALSQASWHHCFTPISLPQNSHVTLLETRGSPCGADTLGLSSLKDVVTHFLHGVA